jgi:HK97 gp10 family phage protein
MDIEIKGLNELLTQFKDLKDLEINKGLLAGAITLEGYAKENAPVKTGFLRNSISSREIENGAQVNISANYAFYVEYGNSKWIGKPFLRPAIDEHQAEILVAIKDELEKRMKDIT